jgi:hypothetical protein
MLCRISAGLAMTLLVALTAGLVAQPASALNATSADAITVTLSGPSGHGAATQAPAAPTEGASAQGIATPADGAEPLARLVYLPVGTTEVAATDLVWQTLQETVALPAEAVRISPIMIARGQPVVVVSVSADALAGRDLASGRLQAVVEPKGPAGAPLAMGTMLAEPPRTHAGVYMIIAADEYVSSLADLVAWKTKVGFKVSLHPTSETGSSRDAIRNFVRNAYQNWDEPPLYLLLVGDVDKVPTGDIDGYVSDNIYGAVDGADGVDFIPDIYVGRFVANTPFDVDVQVAKTVGYESQPDTLASGGEWFGRGLMVAANQGSSTPLPTLHWAADELLGIGYTQVDSCFQGPRVGHIGRQDGPPCVKYYVDRGVSVLGYRGWARGDDGWEYPLYDLTHVPLLANGWKLPVVFSIVCHTGNFGRVGTDCFGEVWMKTGTPQEPRGAVGFIGTAETWSHSRWNDRVAIGIWESFCSDGVHRLSELLADAKISMLEHFPDELYMDTAPISPEESVEYYAYIYNALGDPGLAIWTAKPSPLNVQHAATLTHGQNTIDVQVRRRIGAAPVAGATVALSQDGVPIGVAYTAADGSAQVPVVMASQNPVTLTVTGENLYPWSVELPVVTAAGYLTCTDAEMAGNGLLPGQAAAVTVELTNTGTGSLPLVTATLEVPTGVTVSGDALSFGTIAAGQSATSQAPAQVTVGPETENGAQVEILVNSLSSGNPMGTSALRLPVVAPELTVTATLDGEDNVFDPGEEASLALTLRNAGVPAGEMTLTLRAPVPGLIELIDSTATLAPIATGEVGTTDATAFVVRIAGDVAVGTAIPLTLIAAHAGGPRTVVPFTLVVGQPDFSAPTGPDRYGYYAYDSADIEYPAQVPVYNWIECSLLFGGAGTKIQGIDDNVWSAILPLPYAFQYYGAEFDTVRVDDNGWLAFDTDYWYDLRNWNMPDPWGASSIVAAFWDNLVPLTEEMPSGVPHTDGIYYYNDTERHCFVVEWSRMKNWESNTDDLQTFEILLLDPTYYPTTSGDGVIVFQYKQIQNDDYTRMYSTVGIEDPTETDALVYSYANDYAVGASPLSPGLAIKLTTEAPVLQPITLARFAAGWSFRGGSALSGGSAGGAATGSSGAASAGAGVLVRWEFQDERPLAAFDLYRLPALAEDAWGAPVKLNASGLAPSSGEFFDRDADPQAKYLYRMIGADRYGKERVLGETLYGGPAAGGIQLQLPDGNVLSAGGRIVYSAGSATLRGLEIHDLTGRLVRELVGEGAAQGGIAVLNWDGRDGHGQLLPGGVYWVRLTTSAGDRTARVVVIR